MKATVFTTDNKNHYLYSPYKKMFLPINLNLKKCILNEDFTSSEASYLYSNEYLSEFKYSFDGRLSEDDIELAICNLPQVIFEVTSECNLRCEYCCYGDGYETFKNRRLGKLSIDTAKLVLDFLSEKIQSNKNISANIPFVISFYGGEPLLNINLIKEIVEYSKKLNFPHRNLYYSMTTNATHLAKNIEFLVENNFHLLVSLDGNKNTNQHRKFVNGKESYDVVMNNLLKVKNEYPEYFKKIRYNSVFNNFSNVDEVFDFFKVNFNTIPTLSSIHEPDKSASEYEKIKEIINLIEIPKFELDMDEGVIQIPLYKKIADFLFKLTQNFHSSEFDLFFNNIDGKYATATCIPFSKRMFVTTDGNILPCEKVCRDIPLGNVTNNNVCIDVSQICSMHNQRTFSAKKQCRLCYLQLCCNQCVYNFKEGKCSSFKTQKDFEKILSKIFSYMESNPQIINILENKIVLK